MAKRTRSGRCGVCGQSAWLSKTCRHMVEHRREPPGRHVVADEPARQPGEAMARDGRVADGAEIVKLHPARRHDLLRLLLRSWEEPRANSAPASVEHGTMAGQLGEGVGNAGRVEVGRRGTDPHVLMGDAPAGEAGQFCKGPLRTTRSKPSSTTSTSRSLKLRSISSFEWASRSRIRIGATQHRTKRTGIDTRSRPATSRWPGSSIAVAVCISSSARRQCSKKAWRCDEPIARHRHAGRSLEPRQRRVSAK